MAKNSFEFKKKVVLDYLNGKVGTVAPNCIRKRFNTYIPHQKIKYCEINAKSQMKCISSISIHLWICVMVKL